MPPSSPSNQTPVVEIANDAFRLGILPGLGGCITHLTWRHPGGGVGFVDLMRRADADTVSGALANGNASALACFPMVPFANRIDGGRLSLGHDPVLVPVNRPSQNVAIHGFSRAAAWTVTELGAREMRLQHAFCESGNPYTYLAEQTFTLGADRVDCTLSVTNSGDRALPFGIGFHPWFDRTPLATLSLPARWAFAMDDRQMPLEAMPLADLTGGADTFEIAARLPFDTPLARWDRTATLTWPERRTQLVIEGGGALRLVHIFAPASPDVICIELVSHMPDVVNRRSLAAFGDMAMLEPGETLAGSMTLVPGVVG